MRYAPCLGLNDWFENAIHTLRDTSVIEKVRKLCEGLNDESKELVYRILARTLSAHTHPLKKFFALTKEEQDGRRKLESEFYAHIFNITPDVYCWKGYFLPTQPPCESFYYRHGLNTLKNLDYFKHKDIIDVGGYVGDSAMILSEYTSGKVYSFEATTHNYNLMRKSIELNHLTRVIPINKALGAQEGKMHIALNAGASSFVVNYDTKESEEVEITTLDAYVKEHQIQVGCIKVDIEGFEMEFLKGAKHTICTQKPTMLLSIYHNLEHFFGIKPLLESWGLGYTFSIYKPLDYTISVETMLLCEIIDV